jgi:hypothetical protein
MENTMKIIEVWISDDCTEWWVELADGQRREIAYWDYDSSGSDGRELLESAMKNLAGVCGWPYEFEEQEDVDDETIDDFIEEDDV